jgi:hypothetical protein
MLLAGLAITCLLVVIDARELRSLSNSCTQVSTASELNQAINNSEDSFLALCFDQTVAGCVSRE